MDSNTAVWIDEYLQWMNGGEVNVARAAPVTAAANTDFVAAYLEWMDSAPQAAPSPSTRSPVRVPVRARIPAWAGIEVYRPEALREAILLMALQTEYDCVHVLRQAVDAGAPTPDTVDLARDALRHAERLLDDEESAWRALNALYRCDLPRAAAMLEANPQSELSPSDWPHALEGVMADVRALTGRVLALHTH